MTYVEVPKGASLAALAHELSKRCTLWTFQREWKPGSPYPLKPDPRERTALLLEHVVDVVVRPDAPYEFHAAYRERGTPMTLLERLTIGLSHLNTHGEHWRSDLWTVCEGSRVFGAYVPMVRWFRGVFAVHFRPVDQELSPDERAISVHIRNEVR